MDLFCPLPVDSVAPNYQLPTHSHYWFHSIFHFLITIFPSLLSSEPFKIKNTTYLQQVFIQTDIFIHDKRSHYEPNEMSQEPSDDLIEETILEQLSALETYVRPNKLRKIVCRTIRSTNWTQFQRVLDRLIETEKVKLKEEEGEKVIFLSTGNTSNDNTKNKNSQTNDEPSSRVLNDVIEVPIEIVSNLLRKGKKKQKNIETNTKTTFTFDKDALLAVRKNDLVSEKMTNITIRSEILNDVEIAKKHINTAKLMIQKMVQAFKENPGYFMRKAGGTFSEQEEAKQRKAEVIQKLHKKKKNYDIGIDDDLVQNQHGKKKRKFY